MKRAIHLLLISMGSLLALTGCLDRPLSMLDPIGPAAHSIARVWWAMFWGGLAIYLIVLGLAAYALLHRRRNGSFPRRALLVGGGLALPLVVITLLMVYGIRSGQAMLPLPTREPVFRVEVRAHQWWWEVSYPDAAEGPRYGANEIHIPADTLVDVHVSSADVIHSFWIPRLAGKIDAIPGRTNVIRLRADRPGEFLGLCSEYCGVQHARMTMVVHAHAPQDVAARLAEHTRPRAEPDTPAQPPDLVLPETGDSPEARP